VNPAGLHLEGHPIKDIFGRTPGQLADDLYADQSHPMAQLMHAADELTNDVGRAVSLPFEVVRPMVTTMAATAKLAWDPYLHNPKLPKRLWRITAPTLIVHGAQDRLIPPEHTEFYAANIDGAKKVDVDGAGHMLPLEKPDELTDLVRDFVGPTG
jgi:pimeloyl-ACP methyl ester carboxylesterase